MERFFGVKSFVSVKKTLMLSGLVAGRARGAVWLGIVGRRWCWARAAIWFCAHHLICTFLRNTAKNGCAT
jgi:hypothetical protein